MNGYTDTFYKAFKKAIATVGVDVLKKTSLFGKNAERLNRKELDQKK